MASTIRFLGAVGTVTGSRFIVEGSSSKVMIDCGLYQGLKELRLKNWEPFPDDAKSIDAIVISHAHLDHCGYTPLLVKAGFSKTIYATENTLKLADVILNDSARIQMEDAKYALKKGFSKHNPPKPLYDENDVYFNYANFSTFKNVPDRKLTVFNYYFDKFDRKFLTIFLP